ncbi:MAG: ATP-binding protein [Thalassospira sp.]|uniref:hypothetical protein n=1 Tax=Thalassospira sp. TaxID=1912094 RepID=UPI001B06AD51|nr:hypothetical protein [Thalassospira sp.]MBO6506780.1 ATP-binding protein [Kordiimonadaceae bacterium]MBO6817131.1 ATP-binding protein [Thalassospira sp.]MBO6889377.1 ATP-binding protein [Thalassospira sp.]
MVQSPELAGGDGFNFEGQVASLYLSALLAEAEAPGIENATVCKVAFQQRDFGHPLDDVIVDFIDNVGEKARLSLQIKRELKVNKTASNRDFRDIVRDSWGSLNDDGFREGIDRFGAGFGDMSPAKKRDVLRLCEYARASSTLEHFEQRFAENGNASKDVQKVKEDIHAVLSDSAERDVSNEELRRFLAHFVLVSFDFLHEGAVTSALALANIRSAIADSESGKCSLVWAKLNSLARLSAGVAGEFDRSGIIRELSPIVRLRGRASFQADLRILGEIASGFALGIQNDVGAVNLPRVELSNALAEKLDGAARIIQVRGLPGTGKSVLLRQSVQDALTNGPVLFLRGDHLECSNWRHFATAHGISNAGLTDLLVDLGAVGTPIFYLDAADRVTTENEGIVLDIFNAIFQSPLLDNWKIVMSFRDGGVGRVQNWIEKVTSSPNFETLTVKEFTDKELEVLVKKHDHLRVLFAGSKHFQDIARRPFFTKILFQSAAYSKNNEDFSPLSELDLIENWWERGGYNSSAKQVAKRQRAIVELGAIAAENLSKPISLFRLSDSSNECVHQLVEDGILQVIRLGHTVRFAHDIFFEWAYFQLLASRDDDWLDAVIASGEPPALARVVELTSQWEYKNSNRWTWHLMRLQDSSARSQWLRSWLLGPVFTPDFVTIESDYAKILFDGEGHFLHKALVWFQAEKTAPNGAILASDTSVEQKQLYAYLLGIPSDFLVWRNFITFLLKRIEDIPVRLYSELLSVFEVWQNALAAIPNGISPKLMSLVSSWIEEIDSELDDCRNRNADSRWSEVSGLERFRERLASLLLSSAWADSQFARRYLNGLLGPGVRLEKKYKELLPFSVLLAQKLPEELVEVTKKYLMDELPDDLVRRRRSEGEKARQFREKAREKAREERTRAEQHAIDVPPSIFPAHSFSHHDWDRLCIKSWSGEFSPPSPVREPFHSLFEHSPENAIRLVRELCNHSVAAWKQLHKYDHERKGTPLALELDFPWGTQAFWGSDRHYLWSRGEWAPDPVACGLQALEEWSIREVEKGREVDELIREVVQGNESISVVGIAATIALYGNHVSEVTFPLVTSQRVLSCDNDRWRRDITRGSEALIGFDGRKDQVHIEEIKKGAERSVRQKELSQLLQRFFVFSSGNLSERVRAAVLAFPDKLPFRYEEHRSDHSEKAYLATQADEYAELVENKNYALYRTDVPNRIAVQHTSPSQVERSTSSEAQQSQIYLETTSLLVWADQSIKAGVLDERILISDVISRARRLDDAELFEAFDTDRSRQTRNAVSAVAAVLIVFESVSEIIEDDIDWAIGVLIKATEAPENRSEFWTPKSIVSYHHQIYAAIGFSAALRRDLSAYQKIIRSLLKIITHPLEEVSSRALEETFKLWDADPRLAWASLHLAMMLCQGPRDADDCRGPFDPIHDESHLDEMLEEALRFYTELAPGFCELLVPEQAWRKVSVSEMRQFRFVRAGHDDAVDMETDTIWVEPEPIWRADFASKVLPRIPVEKLLSSSARTEFLKFLSRLIKWNIEKVCPTWATSRDGGNRTVGVFELTSAVGEIFGRVAGYLTFDEIAEIYLDPVSRLDDKSCWRFLTPFTQFYTCVHVLDAAKVAENSLAVLGAVLDRFLQSKTFDRTRPRSGQISGFEEPALARCLMFVKVTDASGAARFANGDWQDLEKIMPLIDRYAREVGWSEDVLYLFLDLCERAKEHYSPEVFADQVLAIVDKKSGNLLRWHGTMIPARISRLIKFFSDKYSPLEYEVAQKLLRVLDLLVDLGDRRSAALQFEAAFREVRRPR